MTPIQWKLKNEKKIIDGFICYKAQGVQVSLNNGIEIQDTVVTWYAPDIAFNFGPIGFNGLPGMIVSLSIRGEHYFLKGIEFKTDKIVIKKPTKGRSMTYLEFVGIFNKNNRP